MTAIEPRLKALMLRGLDGDSAAYAELLEALGGYLRAYFGRRLGSNSPDVEDLVQETLLSIHLKRETYDRSLLFTPWAYAMARYKLLDYLRKNRRNLTVTIDGIEDLFAAESSEEGATRGDLSKLLGLLPPRQRRLIEDVKLTGLSMDEAGAKAGMSGGAARVRVHRGLRLLGKKVRDEDR